MRINRFWSKLINIGFTKELTFVERRNLRLTNTISLFVSVFILFIIIVFFVPLLLSGKFSPINLFFLCTNLATLFNGLLVIYLNYKKRHLAAKITGSLYYFIFLFSTSIIKPQPIFSELFLLIWLCFMFILFEDKKTIYISSALCLVANLILVYFLHLSFPGVYKPLYFVFIWMVIGWGALVICLQIFKSEYLNYQRMIEHKNRILKEGREELLQLNEELRQTNDYLDEKVNMRTNDLLKLNESLIRYNFINVHKVRAPLARIMGLINLIREIEGLGEDDALLFFHLKKSAEELDKIIDEVRQILELAEGESTILADKAVYS